MRGWFVVVAVLFLAGCNGPKDSCQGSTDSFFSIIKGHDWDTMFELLTPEHKRKVGNAARLNAFMEDIYKGTKNFKVSYQNVAETKTGVCVVNGTMSYTIKIRGENPVDINDEYFSWTLKKGRDGLWYIDIPGEEKIGGY